MSCARADTFKPAQAYNYITLFVQLVHSFLAFVQICSLHLVCTIQSKFILPSMPKSDLILAEAASVYSPLFLPARISLPRLYFRLPAVWLSLLSVLSYLPTD